jgi:hypothetical protein
MQPTTSTALEQLCQATGKQFKDATQILEHLPIELTVQNRLCKPILFRRTDCWVAQLHSFGKAQFPIAVYTDQVAIQACAKLALFVLDILEV